MQQRQKCKLIACHEVTHETKVLRVYNVDRLKFLTQHNAISRQPCEILYLNLLIAIVLLFINCSLVCSVGYFDLNHHT